MIWQTAGQQFLVQGNLYPVYLSLSVNRVQLPDGSLIHSAYEYFHLSADGSVLKWYREPWTSTLEDCLYVMNIHSVIGRSLYEFSWTECYGRAPALEEKVCLRDLQPVPLNRLPLDGGRIVEEFHLRRAGSQY